MRSPQLPLTARRLLAALLLALFALLGGCGTPARLTEIALDRVEQQTGSRLMAELPVDVARTTLAALDRGDFHSVRLLFAGAPGRRDATINAISAHWPVGAMTRPDLVSYVGPYKTRTRLEPVPLGTLDIIPVRYQLSDGEISARIVLQRTDLGWQLIDIRL